MLLTDNSGGRVSLTAFFILLSARFLVPIVAPRLSSSLLLRCGRVPWRHLFRAVALRVVELLALLDGGRLALRAPHVTHRLAPLGDALPLLAVPLLDEHGAIALVVLAGDLDRPREALHAELVEPLLRQVEVLEPPPDLLAREHLVAVLAHRGADRLDGEHGVGDAAIVERRAHVLLLPGALALVVDVLDDVLEDPEVGARSMECRALVGLGTVTGGDHVSVAGRPPIANEMIHPEADGRGFLDRDLVHQAPGRGEGPR